MIAGEWGGGCVGWLIADVVACNVVDSSDFPVSEAVNDGSGDDDDGKRLSDALNALSPDDPRDDGAVPFLA